MGGTQIQAHHAAACIAVLDVGTTSVKACLFTPALELSPAACRNTRLTRGRTRGGRRGEYKAAARAGLADALSQAPGCLPAAVSITTQGETLTLRGPFGRAASPLSGVAGQPRGK